MRRTFILHASGAKLPTDLSGLTCVRYGEATTEDEIKVINEKLRKAIESEGRVARIEGLWWQFSLTERTAREPSAVSLLKISRDRAGALEVAGAVMARGWQPVCEILERSGEGEERAFGRLLLLEGRTAAEPERAAVVWDGEIRMESAERASGYFTTRADTHPKVDTRTSGVYWRADPEDLSIMDGRDERKRAELIAERLRHWKSIKNA